MKKQLTREMLEEYKSKREKLDMYEELRATAELAETSDTVQMSSQTVPYAKHVIAIRGYAARGGQRIASIIERLQKECEKTEILIDEIEDSVICELIHCQYVEGLNKKDAATIVGYSPKQAKRKLDAYFDSPE